MTLCCTLFQILLNSLRDWWPARAEAFRKGITEGLAANFDKPEALLGIGIGDTNPETWKTRAGLEPHRLGQPPASALAEVGS